MTSAASSAWQTETASIRLGVFIGVFVLMALAEVLWPRRPRSLPRSSRWPANLGITLINGILTRLLSPMGAVGFALLAEKQRWGIFHLFSIPSVWTVVLTVVLLDLAIYAQHRLSHGIPLFWRFHRMHHADVDLDVTSGSRFHPVEIAASLGFKFVAIVGLGASPMGVFLFEVILNGMAMFNHSNLKVPLGLDHFLRWLIVTPDMHRVHHSIVPTETDSNFGFNLPWWDRLFRTYQANPAAGQDGMVIGLNEFRAPRESQLPQLLTQPFRRAEGSGSPVSKG